MASFELANPEFWEAAQSLEASPDLAAPVSR
jgi:hypothetical protein